MKKKLLFAIFLAFTISVNSQQTYSDFIRTYNEWTFDFYIKLVNEPQNQVFAPYFMYNSAELLYFATKGGTFKQVCRTFFFDKNLKASKENFLRFTKTVTKLNGINNRFKYAIGFWIEDSIYHKILPKFKQNIKGLLSDTVYKIDFTQNKEKIAEEINNWLKINNLEQFITPNDIPDSASLYLISAAEYEGIFDAPFRYVFRQPFILDAAGRKTKPMDFYVLNNYFEYTENDFCKIIEIPYKDQHFSLQILLPKNYETKSIDTILTYDNYNLWTSTMQWKKITLIMPEFQVTSKIHFKKKLDTLMVSVFKPGGMFLNMIKKVVFLSEFMNYAKIKVNNSGNPADEINFKQIEKDARKTGSIIVNINRPFVFLVKNRYTGAVMFIGHYLFPNS